MSVFQSLSLLKALNTCPWNIFCFEHNKLLFPKVSDKSRESRVSNYNVFFPILVFCVSCHTGEEEEDGGEALGEGDNEDDGVVVEGEPDQDDDDDEGGEEEEEIDEEEVEEEEEEEDEEDVALDALYKDYNPVSAECQYLC